MAALRCWAAAPPPTTCGYGGVVVVVEAAEKDREVRADFGMIGRVWKCGM